MVVLKKSYIYVPWLRGGGGGGGGVVIKSLLTKNCCPAFRNCHE